MDWTDCPLVEVVPGKVSGVPLLKGTRLPADTVLSNFEAGSPVDEISDNFDMPEQTIRDLLTYAAHKPVIENYGYTRHDPIDTLGVCTER